ncbi:hypothetical protein [Petrachloros mirabilis]
MPLIWAAISGHGFGHAAQVVPVLNALGRLVPDLRAYLRTTVPASFFKDRLVIPWEHSAVQQDVGCIQEGPLKIDTHATWLEHERFHATWTDRLDKEIADMQTTRPNLIVADIPYLALAAGKRAGIPAVALASFTWDLVLSEYQPPPSVDTTALLKSIQSAYGHADLALRITPAPTLDLFGTVFDIGPVVEPAASRRTELRAHLGAAEHEQLVLVGFGGIPLESLPWMSMTAMNGYRFIVDGVRAQTASHVHPLTSLPFSFKTVMASVDVIITKPGYGTIVEAVELGLPVIYVRRYNFADEAPLVDFLRQHGRSYELSLSDFASGNWQPALDSIRTITARANPPPCTGAYDAARQLARFF